MEMISSETQRNTQAFLWQSPSFLTNPKWVYMCVYIWKKSYNCSSELIFLNTSVLCPSICQPWILAKLMYVLIFFYIYIFLGADI